MDHLPEAPPQGLSKPSPTVALQLSSPAFFCFPRSRFLPHKGIATSVFFMTGKFLNFPSVFASYFWRCRVNRIRLFDYLIANKTMFSLFPSLSRHSRHA